MSCVISFSNFLSVGERSSPLMVEDSAGCSYGPGGVTRLLYGFSVLLVLQEVPIIRPSQLLRNGLIVPERFVGVSAVSVDQFAKGNSVNKT